MNDPIERRRQGILRAGDGEAFADYDTMCAAVADRVIALVQANPQAVIGLATGNTPKGVYDKICERVATAKKSWHPIDFSRAQFFALDEYIGVAEDDPISYHHYLWKRLLGPIGADPALVHIPDGNAADIGKACAEYEQALARAGKVDLWIVGLGPNGHLAFNEPGSALDSRTREVALSAETRAANAAECHGTTPPKAITVGLGTLKRYAKEVAFLVSGEKKADILARVWNANVTSDLPATLLKTMHTTGYFDAAAAAQLPGPSRGHQAGASR